MRYTWYIFTRLEKFKGTISCSPLKLSLKAMILPLDKTFVTCIMVPICIRISFLSESEKNVFNARTESPTLNWKKHSKNINMVIQFFC